MKDGDVPRLTLSVGTRFGRYELVSSIAAGGMGDVYRARDARLNRDVAVKVLPTSFSSDVARVNRFEREAVAAGTLNHPNVLSIYDVGAENGCPYMVSELLDGETLRSELSSGPLTVRRALGHAIQIARGLAAAHDRGIVHRDLKPENVFITRDGRAKILDFGLAKLVPFDDVGSDGTNVPTTTSDTGPGVVLGTLGYMSPEQLRGRQSDPRSDIFSFGALLYEMLTGRRAFRGDSPADTVAAILREDPADPALTNRHLPAGLDRILRRCLEKDPEKRFYSAHDLAFDLEAISDVSASSPVPSAARVREPGSRRLVETAIAIALALTAGFLAGAVNHARQ
jgi:serine/threonine protein kinase